MGRLSEPVGVTTAFTIMFAQFFRTACSAQVFLHSYLCTLELCMAGVMVLGGGPEQVEVTTAFAVIFAFVLYIFCAIICAQLLFIYVLYGGSVGLGIHSDSVGVTAAFAVIFA